MNINSFFHAVSDIIFQYSFFYAVSDIIFQYSFYYAVSDIIFNIIQCYCSIILVFLGAIVQAYCDVRMFLLLPIFCCCFFLIYLFVTAKAALPKKSLVFAARQIANNLSLIAKKL